MSEFTIRKAERSDMPTIVKMIKDLAEYEKVAVDEVKITAEVLLRDGFDTPRPYFFAFVAENTETKEMVGYAICNFAYSSWIARAMYIEDIYVIPGLRGKRLGHQLFKEICKTAVVHDVNRIDWHVLRDNAAAIKFYRDHGAYDVMEEEARIAYRIHRQEIVDVSKAD